MSEASEDKKDLQETEREHGHQADTLGPRQFQVFERGYGLEEEN